MISIVIPTYNENEVILDTIDAIEKSMENHQEKYEIIVTDDDSPDNTWKTVRDTYSKDNNIHCIRRVNKKKGLGPSVIDGFEKAKGDILFVMDADGQHDERKIPAMIDRMKRTGSDIVLGTRFNDGGSLEGWSKKRIFMSKTAALMARPLLYKKVSDPMSGFFCIRKDSYEKAKNRINPKGYKILLEFLLTLPDAKIEEVGFRFRLRTKGESKLGTGVICEYIRMLIKHGLTRYSRFIRFCIVGTSGLVINETLLFLLTEFGNLYYLYSAAIAIEVSIITNFILNNFWTWKRDSIHMLSRLWKFNLVSVVALTINLSVLYIFTSLLGLHYLISNIIGVAAATFINYFVNDRWTFKIKKKAKNV